ncbi:sigma-70 family RNA polymerase sigma factor [Parerythrobacter jejuensis]|uniref:Sigma-70 family RNA polymerase sigma factor n=1 Tax=Parerythrobacter jejuensis TaxID=795812 RepID=A0A845AJM2_9SPHN|nr:sigma-70 family RNA polymerase sigma factor [Parerythrobacter jejuensis]MXP30450.1 sigma-70 family RNA polymerase sigma factor [Parerythrobacter jejuensis]MXP33210.1 sigma-70 family RNA polymerase sigma factor [Parerythrobacter jejuensis]
MIADEATLAQLMRKSQEGDKRAYAVLLDEAANWLQRYFRRRVPPHQLDDLVQEVLMAVHRKRDTWDSERAFLPWLAAIARYRWVDHLRKVYRTEADQLEDWDAAEESSEEAVLARLSLERLFVKLPEKQAEVIEMVKIEGLSIKEASDKTGQSESLVKVNIHRGLKKLSTLIEKAE